jgi:predicted PurR-regulated permease PerM
VIKKEETFESHRPIELCGEKPNSDGSRHLWQIPVVRDLFWIALAATVLVVAHYLRDILIPILIALGLAYLFDPAIEKAERRWRIPRLGTTLLLLIGLIIAAIILISLLGPILVSQVASLGKNLPAYIDRISKQYDVHLGELPGQITNATEALIKDPVSAIQALFSGTGRFFGVLGSVIGITTSVVVFVLLVPIYFVFFAWRFPAIVAWVSRFVPSKRKTRIAAMANRIQEIFGAFFRARLLICLIMAALFALGWTFVGVPYAFLLGVITGFLCLVPFASVIGWPLAVLLKYLEATGVPQSFDWIAILVWPSVVYLVVQFVEGWVLTPLVHRGSTNLSAITIIIVVFIGGAAGGVIGFILAIPVASSLKMIFEETVLPTAESWAQRH